MRAQSLAPVSLSLILIICLLISAGCTSIPGPETKPVLTPVKTTLPVTTPAKMIPAKTTPTTPHTATPAVLITTAAPSVPPQEVSLSRTCSQQEGEIALPGETCPGPWLAASDTFSCCSQKPARNVSVNVSIVIEPFTLLIDMDDTFPEIQP